MPKAEKAADWTVDRTARQRARRKVSPNLRENHPDVSYVDTPQGRVSITHGDWCPPSDATSIRKLVLYDEAMDTLEYIAGRIPSGPWIGTPPPLPSDCDCREAALIAWMIAKQFHLTATLSPPPEGFLSPHHAFSYVRGVLEVFANRSWQGYWRRQMLTWRQIGKGSFPGWYIRWSAHPPSQARATRTDVAKWLTFINVECIEFSRAWAEPLGESADYSDVALFAHESVARLAGTTPPPVPSGLLCIEELSACIHEILVFVVKPPPVAAPASDAGAEPSRQPAEAPVEDSDSLTQRGLCAAQQLCVQKAIEALRTDERPWFPRTELQAKLGVPPQTVDNDCRRQTSNKKRRGGSGTPVSFERAYLMGFIVKRWNPRLRK